MSIRRRQFPISVQNVALLAAPPPSRFPLKVPPPPGTPFPDQDSFFVSDIAFYAVKQMVVAFQELDKGGVFSPRAFVPRRQYQRPMLRSWELSRRSFLSNGYHLQVTRTSFFGTNRGTCRQVLKTVVVSPVNPNYASECDVTVVAHLAGKKLAALRLSGMDRDWETDFCSTVFEDIVSYRGELLAVDKWGRVFAMDPESLHMRKVASALPNYDGESEKGRDFYLMAASDDLYLMIDDSEKPDWKVYKLRMGLRKWLEVEDEGEREFGDDLGIVTGMHCKFAVAKELLIARCGMMMMCRVPRFCVALWDDYVPIHVIDEDEEEERFRCYMPRSFQLGWRI